ncbi:hypothetical protein [Streptomyces naphthomycinicus]|uniref:hypothetical protein n=1 Tax=Streptomyces naphthomycinicus TaxID=2872625 RepID=UPI001CEC8926|nr:hypothetical protein [Streptomyces sp. TML10]
MVDSDEGATTPRRARFEAVHKWVATGAAVAALAISLYNLAQLQKRPKIDVTLPHLIRIGPRGKGTLIYFQPTVATRFKTQDIEVIHDVRFQLTPTGSISSTKRPDFYWSENAKAVFDFASQQINYDWVGDPAPFIVSQDKPQQPTFMFLDKNWSFQPGRYDGSLQLSLTGNRKRTRKFCLIMSKKAVDEIHGKNQRGLYFFRNDLPEFTSPGNHSDCYVRETG